MQLVLAGQLQRETKAFIGGRAEPKGKPVDASTLHTLCFFSVCTGISEIAADIHPKPTVHFSIDRSSQTVAGTTKGYEWLWTKCSSAIPFSVGNF